MDENRELERLAHAPQLIVSVEFVRRAYRAYIGICAAVIGALVTGAAFVMWLHEQACNLYPKSQYVKELPAG